MKYKLLNAETSEELISQLNAEVGAGWFVELFFSANSVVLYQPEEYPQDAKDLLLLLHQQVLEKTNSQRSEYAESFASKLLPTIVKLSEKLK